MFHNHTALYWRHMSSGCWALFPEWSPYFSKSCPRPSGLSLPLPFWLLFPLNSPGHMSCCFPGRWISPHFFHIFQLNWASPVLVIIWTMSVLSVTVFMLDEPIAMKQELLGGTPLSRLRSRRTPLPSGTNFRRKKTRILGAAHSEYFVILACTILI